MGYNEMMKGQADRLNAHPDSERMEKTVGSETAGLAMNIHAPKTEALDSNKSFMGRAVEHLNRETQRDSKEHHIRGFHPE